MPRVLYLLSQRPSFTGSGITLDSLVRRATGAGWDQRVVVGVPRDDPVPAVGGLDPQDIVPLVFEEGDLDFPVPGMSDVMPYPSSRFSTLTSEQVITYKAAWKRHLARVISCFEPDLIHAHHVWMLSSLVRDVAPMIPLAIRCHATGLRQMELCPHLAPAVKRGCARADAFFVLHRGHAAQLTEILGVSAELIHVVGAGFREELFHTRGRSSGAPRRLLYVGKFSAAKGVPWLLDAFERVRRSAPDLELHVAGSGAGAEAEALERRMRSLAPHVVMHGQLAQPALADLCRRCSVCVLPSFYEGLPLVLVEALACGCSLVATALPGVVDQLAPAIGTALELVPLPRLRGVDTPVEDDLPAFVDELAAAIEKALAKIATREGTPDLSAALAPFTWRSVFGRVESVWRALISEAADSD